MMACRTRIKYTAAGYKADMEALLSKFEVCQNSDFNVFSQIWREMGFGLIFKGRQNEREMREFIEEMFIQTVNEVVHSVSLKRRIAALYLLYALYQKQPLDEKMTVKLGIKIKLDITHLAQVRNLFIECLAEQELTPCFVWFKMIAIDAVSFVYYSRVNVGPCANRNSKLALPGDVNTVKQMIKELMTLISKHLEGLDLAHNQYVDIKDELLDGPSPQRTPKIEVIFDQHYIKDSVQRFVSLHEQFK